MVESALHSVVVNRSDLGEMPALKYVGFCVHDYGFDTDRVEQHAHRKRAPHVRCPFVGSARADGYAASRFLLK